MQAAVALRSVQHEDPAEDAAVALPAALSEPTPEYIVAALPTAARPVVPPTADAEQLIRDWQAGVKPAATRFYYLYKDRIYCWARVKTRDPHLAEDLCQEVWRRIHRSLQTYRPGTSPTAWVYRILINTHRSLWRRGQRFFAGLLPSYQDEHEIERLPEPATSLLGAPEALFTRKQELELILNAMHALPESFRRVVFLRYVEGLPIEEVAVILGISEGTVKSRLNRGLEKLRERLGEHVPSAKGVLR
jgi:RNA polymerase sigma-70 factor (ECF subfamily)